MKMKIRSELWQFCLGGRILLTRFGSTVEEIFSFNFLEQRQEIASKKVLFDYVSVIEIHLLIDCNVSY